MKEELSRRWKQVDRVGRENAFVIAAGALAVGVLIGWLVARDPGLRTNRATRFPPELRVPLGHLWRGPAVVGAFAKIGSISAEWGLD